MSASEPSFYITGGTLRHDAPSYVERQADRDLLDGLLRGEFCYVLTSRQMGKSSLMVRTAIKLRDRGAHVIVMDLTAVGQNLTPEQWYDGLVVRMGRQLRLEDELETFWRANGRLGPCQRLFAALHDVVMLRRSGTLAIFVDEIDTVRSLPFPVDEFFAAIRECYNRRSEDGEFNRLTFCLLGVATPSDLIRDTRTTPFNIGQRIELHDFTRAEAATLAQGLKHLGSTERQPSGAPSAASTGVSDGTAGQLLTRILFWTNGHPYLTQRFCRAVAEGASIADASGVDRLCEELFLSSRALERDDNLLFVRERLLRSEADITSLLELYLRVRAGRSVADDETSQLVTVLRLAGIVTARDGRLEERNRIYRQVFDRQWVRAHLPEADVRRQKAAFRRGVVRTTGIAAVVVAALTVAVLFAVYKEENARRAFAQSSFSRAQALRVSGLAGDRQESLIALREAHRDFTNQAALRDEAIACLALMDLRITTNYLVTPGRTNAVELSPDLAMAAEADDHGNMTLRQLRDKSVMKILPGSNGPIVRMYFSPRDPLLVAFHRGASENSVVVWDHDRGVRLFTTSSSAAVAAVDFSADGRSLAVARADGEVSVYSLPDGGLSHSMSLRLDSSAPRVAQSIRFSPPGDLLAVCSLDDQFVEVWNPGTTQRVVRLYHAGVVAEVAWHPQGELLASACSDGRIYLWRTNEFQKLPDTAQKLAGHEAGVMAVAYNQKGTVLASLGRDETVRLWVPGTGRQMKGALNNDRLERLWFTADDRHLVASGSARTEVRVWAFLGDELMVMQAQVRRGDALRNIDFSPDSRWLMCASSDRATVWDGVSGRMLEAVSLTNACSAWFGAGSRHLVASSDNGLFKWPLGYDTASNPPLFRVGSPERLYHVVDRGGRDPRVEWGLRPGGSPARKAWDELGAMSLSFDRGMAAVVHKNEVLLVPLETSQSQGLQTYRLTAHYPRMAFDSKGQWFAGQPAMSRELHLWNLTATNIASGPSILPCNDYFAFSADGRWLATFSNGSFHVFRVGAWGERPLIIPRTLASDQHAPMAFTRDGRVLAVAASRYTIQLHRMPEDGRSDPVLMATLAGPDRLPLEMLAFSPDSRRLAAASEISPDLRRLTVATDGQIVQLWNLELLREGLAALNLSSDWPQAPPVLKSTQSRE